jgi:hypothetical protein
MPERVELEEILIQNTQIDEVELSKARELLRRLREQGVRRKDYELVPPFGGHRVSVRDEARPEPKLIQKRQPFQPE